MVAAFCGDHSNGVGRYRPLQRRYEQGLFVLGFEGASARCLQMLLLLLLAQSMLARQAAQDIRHAATGVAKSRKVRAGPGG